VQVIRERDEVPALVPSWWRLFDRALDRTPYIAPDWMIIWWDAFASANEQMHLVAVWRDNQLHAVAPLMVCTERHRGREVRVLRFWCNVYSNRVTPLVDASCCAEVIRTLADHILENTHEWDRVELDHLPIMERVSKTLVEALEERGARVGVELAHSSPYLALPASFAEVRASLGSRFRESLHRKRRAAEGRGLRVELSGDPRRMRELLSVCVGSWQHAHGTGIASDPIVRSFYEAIAASWATRDWLQIALLMDGETPIAFEYNLRADGRVSNLKMGYRLDAARDSPGLVLRSHTIWKAIQTGATEFDFLGAADEHKLHWTGSARQLGQIIVYPDRGLGPLRYMVRHRIRPWVRQYLFGVTAAFRRARRGRTSTEGEAAPSAESCGERR
jgi:CelD/BcsL family acetyltransferase involved in cellulose biosynthesis